jgi:hypothetical protein
MIPFYRGKNLVSGMVHLLFLEVVLESKNRKIILIGVFTWKIKSLDLINSEINPCKFGISLKNYSILSLDNYVKICTKTRGKKKSSF